MSCYHIEINGHRIDRDSPVYVVAELSANHNQNFDDAIKLIHAAKNAGADAVKLQTYKPDTITINSDREEFRVGNWSLWAGKTLYEIYSNNYTPWEWLPQLKKEADALGCTLFSTPFDATAVDVLENINVPAYKISSLEIVDIPLIEYVARKGKPVIISTGTASVSEIEEAVSAVVNTGNHQIILLKCTTAYPAPLDEINLRTIPDMSAKFNLPIGISDHSLGILVPIAAISLGACVVEKHLTLKRNVDHPDSLYSLEPLEFKEMVTAIRNVEKSLGSIKYGPGKDEANRLYLRRSLFVVTNIKKGDQFTLDNIRSIRPGYGLHPRYLSQILGKHASRDIAKGTPLSWDLFN